MSIRHWGLFAGSWSPSGDSWLSRVARSLCGSIRLAADAFVSLGSALLDVFIHKEHRATIGCGGLAEGCPECWGEDIKPGHIKPGQVILLTRKEKVQRHIDWARNREWPQ